MPRLESRNLRHGFQPMRPLRQNGKFHRSTKLRHAWLHHQRDCFVDEIAQERKESALRFPATLERAALHRREKQKHAGIANIEEHVVANKRGERMQLLIFLRRPDLAYQIRHEPPPLVGPALALHQRAGVAAPSERRGARSKQVKHLQNKGLREAPILRSFNRD